MKLMTKMVLAVLMTVTGLQTGWAQSYDAKDATFSWAVGNEKSAEYADDIAAAVSKTTVKVGTDLTVGTRSDYAANSGVTMTTYQPGASNAGCVATDMVEYAVTMKKGISLSVASVSYDAIKDGTDAAHYSWSYTVDGKEATPVEVSQDLVLRNNNSNASTAQLNHVEEINAEGCQTFTFRIYISHTANNKKLAFSNIKINGVLNGEPAQRSFKDFELNFMNITELPAMPEGVTAMEGTPRNDAHGLNKDFVLTVPVDGPVQLTLGGCQYSNLDATVTDGNGNLLATIDVKTPGCYHNGGTATWIYNSEEPAVLTIKGGEYTPYIAMKACDLIPMCTITYKDVDGKTIIGTEEVEGNSPLKYAYSAADVTMAEGHAFRGWFNSTQSTAVKVAEGTAIQEDMDLYAKTSEVEVPTRTSRFIYELNKQNFYVEDHEAISVEGGSFHDAQHGWAFGNGGKINLEVAGNSYITIGNCLYSSETTATVTTADGTVVDEFVVKAETDGAEHTFYYEGDATTVTITFGGTTYVHKVTVYSVIDAIAYNEASGYYEIAPDDANSFLLALLQANSTGNTKIYLPNGTYDLGQLTLTTVSGNNISIIGESMEGTVIRNAPLVENEGISTTATLLNTSDGLYLQDLTLQNALDYYASGAAGRAVCLQDKGANTVCKNVKMLSYQDTYYSNKASNFYWEDSEIHGTVDYLCGDGNVVYNRVKLVNESRARNSKSGSDVVCAPNCTATTASRYNWGYVFLDCTIESECKDFTFARSWGGESKATFINTKVLDGSLASSRFTAAGMNVAASAFKEYNTMDAEGNSITPASHVMKFTHSTGDKEYETILTADEAAQFTLENIYGDWAPAEIARQEEVSDEELAAPQADAAYLVDGIICIGEIPATAKSVRKANGRGGFGPARLLGENAISEISVATAPAAVYNLAGQRVASAATGLVIVEGRKVMVK